MLENSRPYSTKEAKEYEQKMRSDSLADKLFTRLGLGRRNDVNLDALRPEHRDRQVLAVIDKIKNPSDSTKGVDDFRQLANAAMVYEQLKSLNHSLQESGSITSTKIKSEVQQAFLKKQGLLIGDILVGKSTVEGIGRVTDAQRGAVIDFLPEMYGADEQEKTNKINLTKSLDSIFQQMNEGLQLKIVDAVVRMGNREQDLLIGNQLELSRWNKLPDVVKIHLLDAYQAATIFEAAKISELLLQGHDSVAVRTALRNRLSIISLRRSYEDYSFDKDKKISINFKTVKISDLDKEEMKQKKQAIADKALQDLMMIPEDISKAEARALFKVAADIAISIASAENANEFAANLRQFISESLKQGHELPPSPVMLRMIPEGLDELKRRKKLNNITYRSLLGNSDPSVDIRKALIAKLGAVSKDIFTPSTNFVGPKRNVGAQQFAVFGETKKKSQALRAMIDVARSLAKNDKEDQKKINANVAKINQSLSQARFKMRF